MRASGILLPVTSLPSPYGIGCFSKEAYEFVDQLEKGGEKYWQILPLGPTGYGDSPYQSFSTYAGNPYFIDLETLIEEGLLTKEECDSVDFGSNPAYVDYEKIYMADLNFWRKRSTDLYRIRHMKPLWKKIKNGWKITVCIWRSKTAWAELPGVSGRHH